MPYEHRSDGFQTLTGDEFAKLFDGLRVLIDFGKAIQDATSEIALALRQPPVPHRRRRYAAQARRRRNEALRQMAAYQRRQAARADAS